MAQSKNRVPAPGSVCPRFFRLAHPPFFIHGRGHRRARLDSLAPVASGDLVATRAYPGTTLRLLRQPGELRTLTPAWTCRVSTPDYGPPVAGPPCTKATPALMPAPDHPPGPAPGRPHIYPASDISLPFKYLS